VLRGIATQLAHDWHKIRKRMAGIREMHSPLSNELPVNLL
jgi:hypothetical protein